MLKEVVSPLITKNHVSEYGHKDYPDLSTEQLMQLSDDTKAVINLLNATYALLK